MATPVLRSHGEAFEDRNLLLHLVMGLVSASHRFDRVANHAAQSTPAQSAPSPAADPDPAPAPAADPDPAPEPAVDPDPAAAPAADPDPAAASTADPAAATDPAAGGDGFVELLLGFISFSHHLRGHLGSARAEGEAAPARRPRATTPPAPAPLRGLLR